MPSKTCFFALMLMRITDALKKCIYVFQKCISQYNLSYLTVKKVMIKNLVHVHHTCMEFC